MGKRKNLDVAALVRHMEEKGVGIYAAAATFGVSYPTVVRKAKEQGIVLPKPRKKRAVWVEILTKAKEEGLSVKDFAGRLRVGVSTVEKAQARVGIHLGHGRPPQPVQVEKGWLLELTNGGHALLDEEDAFEMAEWWWRLDSNGYAYRNEGTAGKNCRYILMHRYLLEAQPSKAVDHANRDKLDNRRCNLRFATAGQQADNMGLRKDNSSGFKGVSRTKNGKWAAQIQHRKEAMWIGTFVTAEAAAMAYDQEARRLKGVFAYVNFPKQAYKAGIRRADGR